MSDTDQGSNEQLPWDGPDEPVAEIKQDDPVVEDSAEPRLEVDGRFRPLMDDGSGFKFHQVTYPEYEALKQAHADGAEHFEMVDDKLHFGGHLVRPA